MNIDFTGKTVIVTGGTQGIGQSIAENFRKLGANLILTGHDKKQNEVLTNALQPDDKGKCIHLDFLNDQSVDEFLVFIATLDRVDVLVNNAGINAINHISKFETKDWENIIKVNLNGPFVITKEVSKKMMEQKSGKIVNIASIFGTITREKRSAYTASKAGVIGLTKTSSVDLAPYNVFVNAVSPGFIATELTMRILKPEEVRTLSAAVPIGRLGQPDEVAKLVLFLASDLNTFITGQNVTIDGGYVNI